MSDEHFDDGERHTPEEWVAILGCAQPVLESVPEWGPHTEQCYETDKVTKPQFMGVYDTAVQYTAAKPSFDLRECRSGGEIQVWFVGDGEIRIVERHDRISTEPPSRGEDVQVAAGRSWERAVKRPQIFGFTHGTIGERLRITTKDGVFTTPKIKRIIVTKGDER